MSTTKPTYKYIVSDPNNPRGAFQSETTGQTAVPGATNFWRTDNPDLAAEVKEKKPWSIVRQYEDNNYQRATRATFTMPAAPWKYDRDRHEQFAARFNAYYAWLQEQRKP